MRLIRTTESSQQTPESMFASKYTWLLRWAMHFSQNNKAAAEDLVQDTFLKLLLSWDSLWDLDNIEPLLYSYLKYAHLTEQRRGQQYSFQSLATIDYDTLAIRLSNAGVDDRIELQDELRRIVAFLLWRKSSARFASIFLLRFFHGYFPDEIAQLCRSSRHAVDLSLRHAREELRSHLKDPHHIEVTYSAQPREAERRQPGLSKQDFVDDLRCWIFSAREGACMTAAGLRKRYESLPQAQIETELLAHIVCCETCLDEVSHTLGVPPASRRSSGDSLGPAPRHRKNRQSEDRHGVEHMLARAQRRMREVREHHPRGLMLALNGQTIAVRDVSSRWAELKVEAPSIATIDLIEVMSDQGLPLLTFPLRKVPPQAAPEQRHEVFLSEGRTMTLLVCFTANGALIAITYDDPSFSTGPTRQFSLSSEIADEPSDQEASDLCATNGSPSAETIGRSRTWSNYLVNLWNSFREQSFFVPLLSALLLIVVAGGVWIGVLKHRPPVQQPTDLLERAVASDGYLARKGVAAAIHQTVELRTAKRSVRREIYRDVQGKRHRKPENMDEQDRLLNAQLDEAGVNWNDPLSAADFFAWHDHAGRYHDIVAASGNLLTLRTSSPDGDVLQESLTVLAADFHPVMRSVQFRDKGAIEIAELEYEVVPWNAASNSWFEVEGAGNAAATPSPRPPQLHVPEHLSDAQIYEAELNALLALKNLHADTERLQVDAAPDGVEVKGVVETEERKRQISSELRMIAHVTPSILCYSDLEKHSSEPAASSVVALSVTSEPSPLERYFDIKEWNREDCTTISHELLQSSATIYRESKIVEDLLTRFGGRAALTANAKATLRTLLLEHLNTLIAALGNEDRSLATFTGTPPQATWTEDHSTLVHAAQRNLDLSKELLYSSSAESRAAPLILADLENSSGAVRAHIAELETLPR